MKNLLFPLAILILISGCGLRIVSSHKVGEWEVDEYIISEHIASFRGGHVDTTYLIDKVGEKKGGAMWPNPNSDSCHLLYNERNDYYINFDLCNQTKTIIKDDKKELDLKLIDSMTIRPFDSITVWPDSKLILLDFDSTVTKRFTGKQMEAFVTIWNSSKTLGYNLSGNSFQWLVTIYGNGGIRKYKIIDSDITENFRWSYRVKDKDFFVRVWGGEE